MKVYGGVFNDKGFLLFWIFSFTRMEGGKTALLNKVRQQSANQKLPPLLKREFQTATFNGVSRELHQPTLRIMQWNLLAQGMNHFSIFK